ncbi:MAG: cytochrome c3 family protein [Candidatus Omnitrophica bacterium]|nr:cytochrome c3 family protein [Candidatus Omnitrophota bacterium]
MDRLFLLPTRSGTTATTVAFLFLSLGWVPPVFSVDWKDGDCMACHGDPGELPSGHNHLLVTMDRFEGGPHDGMACVDCHDSIQSLPHAEELASVNCASCHDSSVDEVAASIHAGVHPPGGKGSSSCVGCHGDHTVEWMEGRTPKETGEKAIRMCLRCHGEPQLDMTPEERKFSTGKAFLSSVHYHELRTGNPDAPSCLDCHGSHGILPRTDAMSTIHPAKTAETCGQCHTQIAETFMASVHGQSLANGYREAPDCTSCHRSHNTPRVDDSDSVTSPAHVSQLCSSCHSSPVVTEKFENLSAKQPATFFDSIHGLAGQLGNLEAANCTSCHGVHDIFASTDNRSKVHPFHVLETCQTCHPGAGPNFVDGKVHVSLASAPTPMLLSVKTLYFVLIVMTLGFMILHNGLVIFRHVLDRLRIHKRVPTVKRFKRIHLIQHHLIALAFVLLAVTGFALKYPHSKLTRGLTEIGMTETVRATTHRVAATAAMTLFATHLVGLFCTAGGRRELAGLMVRWKDMTDFFGNVAYNLGRSETPPEFDRYTYWEKIEYWALLWGMVIMTLTGLTLWFPELVSWFLPRRLIHIAEAIHFFEAALAVGAIFFWHLFFAVYHPKEYPMSTAMITGEITETHMKEIHSVEYQRMKSEQMRKIEIPPREDLQLPQEI